MADAVMMPSVDQAVLAEALAGLSQARKTLPPKLFYDEAGCRLFQRITELPEYYLTRTELGLLETVAPSVAAAMRPGALLVEYGAGDESKAELLLRERHASGVAVFAAYMPVDVATEGLEQARARLDRSYPRLRVHTVAADFLWPVALPPGFAGMPRLGFFPGSTIGNLEPADARRFLAQVRATLGNSALFLVGVDLRKDPAVLIPAYNDAAGVTAAFNRNMLVRLNREAGADFDPSAFNHSAIWNETESRIEMHLVSQRDQVAHIAGRSIRFARNETIHTENSYKYALKDFTELAGLAGWRTRQVWTDAGCLFSVHLLASG
jgi:L-histidine N-alpha-methyltransferase